MVEKTKRRRAHGEGGLRERADGRWEGSVEVGFTIEGKRIRKTVYGSTKHEALHKLKTVRTQIEQGIVPAPDRLTVAAFLTDWLGAVETSLRPKTIHRYREVVNVHLIPGLGKRRLAQLTPQHVETFLAVKGRTPRVPQTSSPLTPAEIALLKRLSPRTVQEIRTILVVALNKAMTWGLVVRNVASLAPGPRVPYREMSPLTADQARTFLAATRGHRLEALYVVAITLGLRQGEVLALKWDDVDFDAGLLHVRRALQRVDGEYELVETKTAKSRRSLALGSTAHAALRDHRVRQLSERLAAGSGWQAGWNLIFCTKSGHPLHGPSVTLEFQRLLQEFGLPRQRFHDLRHACATLLLSQGVELKIIQEILGHSTIAVTANTYSHVMEERKVDAAARMDTIFSRPGKR
ncbi:MAG: site-specific integrase [Chloroflexi bacterium]|nr:site-specific integrase [Chloroflexota bacterium]